MAILSVSSWLKMPDETAEKPPVPAIVAVPGGARTANELVCRGGAICAAENPRQPQ